MARKRNERLYVMVTSEEKEIIKGKMRKSGMTNLGEFIRLALTYTNIINVDISAMRDLSYEINKIGVNINQIAKAVNTRKSFFLSEMKEINEKMELIQSMILEFYKRLNISSEDM